MGKRSSRHIAFSLLLIGLLLAGLLPVAGIAQNDSEKEVIMSFDMPVTELTVPLGTNIEDIPLPETLAATLDGGTVQDIPVTWESDGYHQEAAGTYLFTADIGTWIYPQARPVAVVTVVHPDSHRHISGELWLDKNGDGIRDVGETGIAGYPVTLYAEDDFITEVQTTLTKTDGAYRFEGMEPGSYVVKVSSETIGGTEYLLPLTIGNDNKFAMDEEAAASWSVPLEIGEDTAVTGIDAGMRLPEGIKPFLEVTVDDFSSIQMLINYNQVHSGDTIIIADGANIVFTSSLTINKNLTFRASGSGTVTFTSKNQRHFIIPSGSNAELTFDNVILDGGGTGGGIEVKTGAAFTMGGANIQNCKAEKGGAVYVDNSNIIIKGSMISHNTATGGATVGGGGLYAENNSTVEISDSKFYENESYYYGGGLGVFNSRLTIDDGSEIKENWVNRDRSGGNGSGGGIYVNKSIATIQNSVVSNNSSPWSGCGVYVFPSNDNAASSSLTVKNSEISHNKGGEQGGGIMAWGNKGQVIVNVIDSNIIDNEVTTRGGGLCTPGGSTITITNSVVSDNRAKFGGGIYASTDKNVRSTIEVMGSSKIQNNTASTSGGGIYANDSSVTLDGGTISGNISNTAGGGAYVMSNADFTMKSGEISGNKATGGNGGGIFSDSTVIIKAGTISGNIATDDGGGIYTKDLTKLSVYNEVTFEGNEARAYAKPLPNMYRDKIAKVKSSVYDYPLNNFDINVLIVKVYYVDRSMRPIDGLGPAAYAAVLGDSFTLPDDEIPPIPGYVYVGWKEHENENEEWKEISPVELARVLADTDIYLAYEMRNVTVSQEVIGSYADKTRDFLFTAYFMDSEGGSLAEGTQLQYKGGTLPGSEAPADGMLALGENGEAVFRLKHGQKITIMAVPQGSIRVTEDSPSNYRVSFAVNLGQSVDGSNTGPVILEEINSRFDFRNTRNEEVPTGVQAESMQGPVLLGLSMFLLMVIAGAGMIHSRRKRGL
ncbi:SdrD B-like domain-containing protein [Lacrimispora celerecrescens]|uniref:SD-repeat containing protein B domain-containing protein n=1 Tax=Lacrimispora celerecrescens TaxID=29354 RepID=A0A084JPC9_9FIRM|nr:SdrD B-like domain-containing protein [Lacrimispora celerecrescens]KEZ90813.1 hypothetical protein IO98_06775 [Lacrimispora celerecrescens]